MDSSKTSSDLCYANEEYKYEKSVSYIKDSVQDKKKEKMK